MGKPAGIVLAFLLGAQAASAEELASLPQQPMWFQGEPSEPGSLSVEQEPGAHPGEIGTAPDEAARLAAEEAERSRRVALFEAIADINTRRFMELLNEGADPDGELPFPPPPGFASRFEDRRLRYYVSSEPGFTPLMLATSLGNLAYVRMLLDAGARPNKMTARHKTFALWLAGRYGHVEIMQALMRIGPDHPARRLRLDVSLADQRVTLTKGGEVIFESPISSGKKSHPTPKGSYVVTNKYRDWKSTLYEASMPYFLRLSASDFGLHAGNLPGYPASHGCIRLPHAKAGELFALVPEGTLVEIR